MLTIPEWTYEFHGHRCPFMPLGYRMGTLAMKKLGVRRSRNHEMHVFSEMGIAHPQGCLMDGIQAATGATFGKGMIEKLFLGKVAAVFWYPGKTALRIAFRREFADELAPQSFFTYRKQGVEPSEIPPEVSSHVIDIVLGADDEKLFSMTELPDFTYHPVTGSFNKAVCEECGEYVFERYLRKKDGQSVCIPCSGYAEK